MSLDILKHIEQSNEKGILFIPLCFHTNCSSCDNKEEIVTNKTEPIKTEPIKPEPIKAEPIKISYLSIAQKNTDTLVQSAITKTVTKIVTKTVTKKKENCNYFTKCNKYHCDLEHHNDRERPKTCWFVETKGKCYKCDITK